MKYLPWIIIGCLVTFAIVEFPQWNAGRNAEKLELQAIKKEKDSLAILLKISAHKQKNLEHSIYNRVEDNKRLRGLNEASESRLKQLKQRNKYYEKKLDSILFYTDAAMDGLYRTRYPKVDSLYQLRTASSIH